MKMTSESDSEVKLDLLERWFSRFDSCLIAFSAGVDSSVLACAARRVLGNKAVAVTSVSPAFARSEMLAATRIANEIGIELVTVRQDDLSDENYVANQVSRCYFCRSNLVKAIEPVAKARNTEVCVDGTHLDDMHSPRPGVKALREAGFRAPFVELGFSKGDIRDVARVTNLSNAERPSEACLASRIAYEQRIDKNTLRMIEQSEEFVRQLTGASVVRVRTIGSMAVLELDKGSIPTAIKSEREIARALKMFGYTKVEIDPEGYRQGKMLSLFIQESQ